MLKLTKCESRLSSNMLSDLYVTDLKKQFECFLNSEANWSIDNKPIRFRRDNHFTIDRTIRIFLASTLINLIGLNFDDACMFILLGYSVDQSILDRIIISYYNPITNIQLIRVACMFEMLDNASVNDLSIQNLTW